jgi:hypothetical protein
MSCATSRTVHIKVYHMTICSIEGIDIYGLCVGKWIPIFTACRCRRFSKSRTGLFSHSHHSVSASRKEVRRERLELRAGVLEQHLEVGLVPLAGLGSGLVGIGLAAERIVADGTGVAGAVGLATGLDPDEGVGELEASIGSGAAAEAGTVDVAPVTPSLTQARDGVTAGIDDGVVGHAGGLESGTEEGNILLLILGLVPLGIRRISELTRGEIPRCPWLDFILCPDTGTRSYQEFQPATLVATPRSWDGLPACL